MRLMVEANKSANYLTTIAIGSQYLCDWERYAFPLWRIYCERYGIGLIVFDEDIVSREDRFWKKATWQKLVIGAAVKSLGLGVANCCYLDSDILVNPLAPNVFERYSEKAVALVSLYRNLPYDDLIEVKRRMAFFRNYCYSQDYPLDSSLFMSADELYDFHGLGRQEDFACAGFFVFNIDNHSERMLRIFEKYDRSIRSITGGGDQTHFNYELQEVFEIQWLEYKYQAIWTYEMASKYPFLYSVGAGDVGVVKLCVEASLMSNYFLHFAGSWFESEMWKISGLFQGDELLEQMRRFSEYMAMPLTGVPVGQIKPEI